MQVDLSTFDPEALESLGVMSDQIAIADILVGSKADLVPLSNAAAAAADSALRTAAAAAAKGPSRIARFEEWAASLYPPKSDVLTITNGQLDTALLDRPRSNAFAALTAGWRQPGSTGRRRGAQRAQAVVAAAAGTGGGAWLKEGGEEDDAAAAANPAGDEAGQQQQQQPAPHAPVRVQRPADATTNTSSSGGQTTACGWVFHGDDRFDRPRLLALLRQLSPHVARVKGVFRVSMSDWVLPTLALSNDGERQVALASVCYRGDSCAEVILDGGGGAGGGDAAAAGLESGGDGGASAVAVAAAVIAAQAGNWNGIEVLLTSCLIGGSKPT
jgi:G3E family GTPase